jgi:hypothetical protein
MQKGGNRTFVLETLEDANKVRTVLFAVYETGSGSSPSSQAQKLHMKRALHQGSDPEAFAPVILDPQDVATISNSARWLVDTSNTEAITHRAQELGTAWAKHTQEAPDAAIARAQAHFKSARSAAAAIINILDSN